MLDPMLTGATPVPRTSWLADLLARGLPPISGGDGTDDGTGDGQAGKAKADDDDGDDDLPADLGDKGKAALAAERAKRREAAARTKAAEAKLAEVQRAADEAAAAQAKADEEAAAKRGEFEALAAKRERERDEARTERDALRADYDALAKVLAEQIAAGAKDLPDALKDFDPGEDAPLPQRWAWFAKASKRAGELTARHPSGNGRDPKPARDAVVAPRPSLRQSQITG